MNRREHELVTGCGTDSQRAARETDVLVIGAGPAGLALGVELKRRSLSFRILERSAVGSSWQNMPHNLKLISPWKANRLPGGTRKNPFPRHHQASRTEFLAYLQAYAREHQLPVEPGVDVRTLDQLPNGRFRARTTGGEFRSGVVVNATGYFSNPYTPQIEGAQATAIPQIHAANYSDPVGVESLLGQREGSVLIVGQRLSAGQIMVELVGAGFEVALSHRSPVQFGVGPVGWWFLYRIFPWLERFRLAVYGSQATGNDVRMQGGRARKLIESGRVKTFPVIRRFEKQCIVFDNGEQFRAGLVIYATGFRPALRHLQSLLLSAAENGAPRLKEFESVSVAGLFFLGLDGLRNFQSRFLRGIRRDAVLLAARIDERLAAGSSRARAQAELKAPVPDRGVPMLAPVQRELVE
jgi:hypothetical protein